MQDMRDAILFLLSGLITMSGIAHIFSGMHSAEINGQVEFLRKRIEILERKAG